MIVITTPTGQIGRQVLDRILDSGEAARVIARDPSRLPARVLARAEVVPRLPRRCRHDHEGSRRR